MPLTKVLYRDNAIVDNILFEYGELEKVREKTKIRFQFPPRITSDSRSFNWSETNTYTVEPLVIYSGTGARKWTLKAEYVVWGTNPDDDWNVLKVKEEINKIRSYHNGVKKAATSGLVVRFKYPYFTGPEPWTCRISNISLSYSDRLVTYADPNGELAVFPIKTIVNIDMALWTKISFVDADGKENEENLDPQTKTKLKDAPRIEDLWY